MSVTIDARTDGYRCDHFECVPFVRLDSRNAFASNADGTLTVVHEDTPDRYHVLESVQTPQGSRNMGLVQPTTKRVRSLGKVWTDPTRNKAGTGPARNICVDSG